MSQACGIFFPSIDLMFRRTWGSAGGRREGPRSIYEATGSASGYGNKPKDREDVSSFFRGGGFSWWATCSVLVFSARVSEPGQFRRKRVTRDYNLVTSYGLERHAHTRHTRES
ncbi:unnamed protein product, partial [Ectocarpus sp. 12 AP-2014]